MGTKFIISGGKPLTGTTEVRGSKNAATKMMIASLLTQEPCIIQNIPRSGDIEITKELCEKIGSRAIFNEEHHLTIETPKIRQAKVPQLSRKNRIPVLALGPLLHRSGLAEVPVVGGCPIGHRPINFHLEALSKMGARIERRENSYFAEAPKLHGAKIEFPFPSVGATENVMLAAVLANGKTIIKNAAVEPEIMNLAEMLRAMGAEIDFLDKEREIQIEGVSKLKGATVRVMPDRNEVVSLAVAALATDGDIMIQEIEVSYLAAFLKKLKKVGAHYEEKSHGMRFFGKRPYRATFVETAPHPGFMTDWQQPFGVLLTQTEGTSIIHETVYEDRFGYTQDLNRMGADIQISDECPTENHCRYFGRAFNHTAKITGPTQLHGAKITMTDIRAGMAHIIAALATKEKSAIWGVEHVDRGYEKIDERLRKLGARIERID